MFLTDLSIKRPVVASVMSIVLVIFGLVTFQEIPTDELPDVQPPVVTIQTDYKGASAEIIIFIPLIAAMGGNVGIQSSALVVQGIANQSLSGSILSKLFKEFGVGVVNGLLCGILLFLVNVLMFFSWILVSFLMICLMTFLSNYGNYGICKKCVFLL